MDESPPTDVTETTETAIDKKPEEDKFDLILDLPLQLSVVLGDTRLSVRDLVKLENGSVVELGNLAGEPLKVFINNRLIAKGTAVVVNEKFGIKLTEIISKKERLRHIEE